MKKILIPLILLFGLGVYSQTTSEIFEYKSMTFYGLDFTSAKCIGISEFPSGQELIDTYFQDWNDVFMVGRKRIKIGKPYKKNKVEYDTMVFEYNRQINPEELIISGSYFLKKSDIPAIAEKYADKEKTGIGMVYIVEALNADDRYISVWITFFKNSTGEVLLTEPLRAKGKGKRIEEHWLVALLRLYEESAYDYKTWSKIYR